MTTSKKPKPPQKPMSLRQRLRRDAEAQLNVLIQAATEEVAGVCLGTGLNPLDLMHVASANRNQSLRTRLIVILTNAKEKELEKLYNDQQKLDLDTESSHGETKV